MIDLNHKKVLTYQECLEYTGFSDSSLRKLVSANIIRHYKPTNGKVFFKKEEVDDFLLTNPSDVTDEELTISHEILDRENY